MLRPPLREAQKLAIPHPRHRTLADVDLKPEFGEQTDQRLHHPLTRPLGPHIHVAVIRVPGKAVPASLQLLVHLIQEHIRQQRREWPTLRRPLVPLLHDPVRHHPGFEIAANEREHATVPDSAVQLSHEHIVVDAIEELFQIDVHHPAPATLHVALRLTHRVMRPTPRPKAVAGLREGWIESRLQDL